MRDGTAKALLIAGTFLGIVAVASAFVGRWWLTVICAVLALGAYAAGGQKVVDKEKPPVPPS